VAGGEITLYVMEDAAQGLGKRARGCLIQNVRGAGFTGVLGYQLFDGNVWSDLVTLIQGAFIVYSYEDYVFIEQVRVTATGGAINYKVHAVPGLPENWELEELGIPVEGV
jgi:hypothetical protein